MFDYSFHMMKLVEDICHTCKALNHIDTKKVLVAVSRSRSRSKDGLQAKLVPMRFQGGLQTNRFGRDGYEMPRICHEGNEILYLIYFCLPRFQNLRFEVKMSIIFHELYHISPLFNGDIRRFPGRFYQHSHSEKEYDRIVGKLSNDYLGNSSNKHLMEFLKFRYEVLREKYGEIGGMRLNVPEPKLLQPKQELLFDLLD